MDPCSWRQRIGVDHTKRPVPAGPAAWYHCRPRQTFLLSQISLFVRATGDDNLEVVIARYRRGAIESRVVAYTSLNGPFEWID
jgi:hypothetical protein